MPDDDTLNTVAILLGTAPEDVTPEQVLDCLDALEGDDP